LLFLEMLVAAHEAGRLAVDGKPQNPQFPLVGAERQLLGSISRENVMRALKEATEKHLRGAGGERKMRIWGVWHGTSGAGIHHSSSRTLREIPYGFSVSRGSGNSLLLPDAFRRCPMPVRNPVLSAGQLQTHSHRLPRPESTHALTGTLEMMGARMSFSRNEEIYGEAEAADYLYKVVSGAVRMYKVLNDGRRQIGAFYFPGDILALNLAMCMLLLPRQSVM
jgi:hypothetical protein